MFIMGRVPMKPILFLCLAFTTSTVLAESSVINVPGTVKLTEAQMDNVTAGEVFIVMEATAAAQGEPSHTYTNTATAAYPLGKGGVEKAEGFAEAFAYGSKGATTSADGYGGGDGMITITKERSYTVTTDTTSYSVRHIRVYTIHPPGLANRNPSGLAKKI
jgi:hypothetical protein